VTRLALAVGLAAAVVLLALGLARAAKAPAAAPAATADLERVLAAPPGTPRYIAGYRKWLKVNRRPIPNSPTTAHPATVKDVFVNRKTFPRAAKFRLPYGTILVKEGRSDDGTVVLLALMRKVKGANPKHNDWVWIEYTRSSASERFGVQAKGAICWGCHQGVAQRDYVWTKR
jgi:hypothetical protein